MHEQRELIFHDTVPLPEEELGMAREKAFMQRRMVLDFFRQRFSMNFTPTEVWEFLNGHVTSTILLTSVRRSITDLTKEGRLVKCDWSESRPGKYGKLNRVWRYRIDYLEPLNAKK